MAHHDELAWDLLEFPIGVAQWFSTKNEQHPLGIYI